MKRYDQEILGPHRNELKEKLKKFVKTKDPELGLCLLFDPLIRSSSQRYITSHLPREYKMKYLNKVGYVPVSILTVMLKDPDKNFKLLAYERMKKIHIKPGFNGLCQDLYNEVYSFARSDNQTDIYIALDYYITTKDESIGYELVSNENLPIKWMKYFCENGSPMLKNALARNLAIPLEIMEKLVISNEPTTINSLLSNKNLTLDKFEKLLPYFSKTNDSSVIDKIIKYAKEHNLTSVELLFERKRK